MNNYILLSKAVAFAKMFSDDTKLQVGACIETSNGNTFYGTNRFLSIPEGFTKNELQENRDLKLKYITHAEVDAILNSYSDVSGSTIYVNYTPCSGCAKKIIEKGIKKVVTYKCKEEGVAARWQSSWDEAIALLTSNGVEYEEV